MKEIIKQLKNGGVVAIPTESVFGLSCDAKNEQAVLKLLEIKARPVEKGLIVAVSSLSQINDWIAPLTEDQLNTLGQFWPGPYTFILAVTDQAPQYLTGEHNGLAVRISAHPVLKELTAIFGPVVTTSANKASEAPCMSYAEVLSVFGDAVACLDSELGDEAQPTQIVDLISGGVIR